MATPPFNLDTSNPADGAIASLFPANERPFRDQVASYLNTDHDINTGHHAFPNLTTTARNALVTPPTGMLIWNTVTLALETNTGTPGAPVWSSVQTVANIFAGTMIHAALVTMTGAAINENQVTLASASTVNIGAATGNYVFITGTVNINLFDTVQSGVERTLLFQGILTIANNANIALPGGVSIVTAAGDVAVFRSEGAGVWRCVNYMKASGLPVVTPAIGLTKSFDSGLLSVPATTSTVVAVSHTLGVQPKIVFVVLQNVTAEGGYSTGDQIQVSPVIDAGSRGLWWQINNGSTNSINIISGQTQVVTLPTKSGASNFNITPGNWNMIVRAYA